MDNGHVPEDRGVGVLRYIKICKKDIFVSIYFHQATRTHAHEKYTVASPCNLTKVHNIMSEPILTGSANNFELLLKEQTIEAV
jgi:hypothetical protein